MNCSTNSPPQTSRSQTDHSVMDHSVMDHSVMDHSVMDHSVMDHSVKYCPIFLSEMDEVVGRDTRLETGSRERVDMPVSHHLSV